jgi:hypothetical protein
MGQLQASMMVAFIDQFLGASAAKAIAANNAMLVQASKTNLRILVLLEALKGEHFDAVMSGLSYGPAGWQ